MDMQSRNNNESEEDATLQAPNRLISALKQRPEQPIFIPPTVDEAVLRAAQRHLAKPAPPGLFQSWRWAVAGGAAVILIALIPQYAGKQRPADSVPAFATQDLNQDGTLDILDAFTLARQLKDGGTPAREFDFNGDGRVDERDTAMLAARAVQLQRGGRS